MPLSTIIAVNGATNGDVKSTYRAKLAPSSVNWVASPAEVVSGKSAEVVELFVGAGSLPEYPVTYRRGWYNNPKANEGRGSVNTSYKLSTYEVHIDADGLTTYVPITVTVAVSREGRAAMGSVYSYAALLENAFTKILPQGSGCQDADGAQLAEVAILNDMRHGIVAR